MGLWHAVSAISPPLARAELFRLGHVEETKRNSRSRRGKKKIALVPSSDALLPSREFRALLLGSPGSGKTSLLNALGGSTREPLATMKTRSPRTASTFVKLKRKYGQGKKNDRPDEVFVAHLIITEVPEASAENQAQRGKVLSEILNGGCDMVILAFDSTNSASLAYAKHLESSLLNDNMARVYVGTKSDQCGPTEDKDVEDDDEWQPTTVIDEACIHCRELDLEPPLVTSASESMLSAEGDLGEFHRQTVKEHLVRCVLTESGLERLRSKPHAEQKRLEAARRRNRKMIWFGVGVGVAVAVVGYLITSATGARTSKSEGRGRPRPLSWFRSMFFLGASSSGDSTAVTE